MPTIKYRDPADGLYKEVGFNTNEVTVSATQPTDGSELWLDTASTGTTYVASTGDTMTGGLTISMSSADYITLNAPASGTIEHIVWEVNNLLRWSMGKGSTAESTGNVGSDFNISGWTDAGAYLNTPLKITRSTGEVLMGADPISALGVATKQYVDNTDFFNQRKTSYCATSPDSLAQTSLPFVSGTIYAPAVIVDNTQSFTNVSFMTGTTAPATLTDVKLAVWNSAGTLLRATADIKASVTAANQLVTVPLTAALSLTKGQQVYLGIAWVGTTLHLRGYSTILNLNAARGLRSFIAVRANTGWAGGTVPALGTSSSAGVPWIELS